MDSKLLLILIFCFQYTQARVDIYEKFFQVLVKGSPSSKVIAVQSDTNRGVDYEEYSADTFKQVPNLEDLYIINKINTIHPRALQQLVNLRSLTLEENDLPDLHAGDFSNLRLSTANLIDNNINMLESHTFANASIDKINLSNNRLSNIPAHALDVFALTQLSLANNEIAHIAERAFSVSLVRLDLSCNRIRDVPITAFENLFALEYLNISHNKLPTLSSAFWLRNLEVLDASHNMIRLLLNGAFEDYPKLRQLHLDHNELLYLNPESFSKPSPIQVLYIHRNLLTSLPIGTPETFTNLRRMVYGGNPWSCTCLILVENFIKARKVQQDPCEKDFFTDGKQPVCLSAFDNCLYNETLVLLEHPLLYTGLIAGYRC